MGYTQYFQQGREITEKEWGGIMKDAASILQQAQDSGIRLAADYDEPDQSPVVSLDMIRFNGVGAEGHETFHLPRKMEQGRKGEGYRFNFCKTARKPYDAAVCAIMLSMHHHAPGAWDLGSDGDLEDEGWKQAIHLYAMATHQNFINTDFLNREEA